MAEEKQNSASGPQKPSMPASSPGQNGTILLVDDDHFLLDMYSMKFMQKGFAVEACQSTADALTVLRGGLKPAAILFDIVMPGDDGFSFLSRVKEEKLAEGAKTIALTNQSNDGDKVQAEKLGVDKYVVKASMIPSEVVTMTMEAIGKK
ncbi:MAG: chemotaxis protein histidine kinase-like protein [Parcubacteria group bacterium Gr01-1014_8]|nr:MAG: chemotaxis protein histidine kinase-like protein [Parcubacteria group bacterium Gr01-1014_8]